MIIPHLLFLLIHSIQTSFLSSSSERLVSSNSAIQNLCMTPGCVRAAAEVQSNLDENVDPCEDFYRFACGGWMNRHDISEGKSYVSVRTEAQDDLNLKFRDFFEKKLDGSEPSFVKMFKEFYDSCMDLETIEDAGSEPLKTVIKSLGGWPVVEGSHWNDSNFDWIQMLASFRKMGFSHNILLYLLVTNDYENDTVNILRLEDPFLFMERRHLVNGLDDSATAAYFKLMVKSAKLLGADEETAKNELLEALRFEIALANFTMTHEERRNRMLYTKYTVKELQETIPKIPWLKYFNAQISDEIHENETLIVSVPEFAKNFAELISRTEKRVVANYMVWRAVAQYFFALSKDWRDLHHEYLLVVYGESAIIPRRDFCFYGLDFEIALSSYYVRKYFKEESKDAVSEIVKYIHKELLNILEESDWMEENTKEQAKAKANDIKAYIGYPSELLNDTAVLEIYKNLTITNGTFFENTRRLRKWTYDQAFSQLRKPIIRGEWKKHATTIQVGASYNKRENSIEFPAAILQNAFFNKDRPHYMNFAAIGCVIGHEITHGFDHTGRWFDKDGEVVNWWDETTYEHYKNKTQCIIDQYNNYIAENGMKVNGVNTQDENIADNGGLKGAYLAYRSWVKDNGPEQLLPGLNYSQSQMFWISSASVFCTKYRPAELKNQIISGVHTPDQFRVVGPMSNLAEFAKDFNCSPDSPMNKQPKCQVW